ncbi:MAG TPA: GGDEF domain-containing protein [Thermoleophilaceae bacterium]|nr:GGDEF domain-containing protein [Thermoleophilaceae bacterium]
MATDETIEAGKAGLAQRLRARAGAWGGRLPAARAAAVAASLALGAAGALWVLDAGADARGVGLAIAVTGLWLAIASLAVPRRSGAAVAGAALVSSVVAVSACQAVSGASPTGYSLIQIWLAGSAALTAGRLLAVERARGRAAASVTGSGLALLDRATGAGSQAAFEQRAAAELARSRRHDLPFAIARIDLAGLTRVRTDYGDALADEVVRGIAIGISASLRGEDFLARFDGERFAVLLAGAHAEGARRVTKRIGAGIEGLAEIDERLTGVSASIGTAVYPDDGPSLDVLLSMADAGAQIGSLRD